jgi:hypothetical protein
MPSDLTVELVSVNMFISKVCCRQMITRVKQINLINITSLNCSPLLIWRGMGAICLCIYISSCSTFTVKSLGIVGINCGRSLSNALYLIENMLNSHTYHTFLRLCRHSNLISLISSSTVCLWLIVCFPSHVNCKNKVEDEKHFILYCPLYKNLRNKYII